MITFFFKSINFIIYKKIKFFFYLLIFIEYDDSNNFIIFH
jgi:hypothetical protein